MNEWPTNWKELALRAAGVPVTQHALDVLTAWFKATPTQSWTNNPLGLPHEPGRVPKALNTPYGAFPTHEHFRQAFKTLAHGSPGKIVIHVLMDEGNYAGAWRAIHALNLPGNATETDYPATLLDMVEDKYRSKLQTTEPADRKSMGTGTGAHQGHQTLMRASDALGSGAQGVRDFSRFVNSTLRGYGNYGR